MARKTEHPKPLFALKHEFYESLDHLLPRVVALLLQVDSALELGVVRPGPTADILKERAEDVKAALMVDDQ